ncbi:MAG: ydgJ [Actinomycetia bacterium]|nr:ydgJ [Actinomycetes bacterium]
MTRVGLIGYGTGGAVFHAPLIAATPGLDLTAVVTANPDRQAQVRASHPGATTVTSADELWDAVDLVVVTSPNRTHGPLARAALEHGLAVVVDKPVTATAAEARELAALAHQRGLLFTVFQNRRWDGDYRTVRRLVDTGALGHVARFESRFERWRPVPKPGWKEQADPAAAGGILYDLGSHLVDQALHLFGPAASVYAEIDRRREGAATDDDVFVAITHERGVRSHLWMSAVAAQNGPRFRVLGDRSAYTKYGLDPQEDALRAGGVPGSPGWGQEPPEHWGLVGAGDAVRPEPTDPGAYQLFYAQVAAALSGGGPVPVDPAGPIAALEVIETARASARSGSPRDL